MRPKALKAIAVCMLVLAMAAIAVALYVSNQRVHIQGPSALVAMPDDSVWLTVDDALWHLDATGTRIKTVQAAALAQGGLHGLIGNLVVHPNGQLVASVKDDPTLYFLDPAVGTVTARMVPQWPLALAKHGSRAINYAFHDDGRVAIATGGGHTVAVFDARGAFIAQTPPGTYEFTNGLWWADGSLWTTNTNGLALIALDANTLAQKSQVKLVHAERGWRFLGMAVASHGAQRAASVTNAGGLSPESLPLATVVRFANGMVVGHAVDVFPDGSQSSFPVNTAQEPRDIKWRGKELLLVDGASYTVKRYDDNRMAMADFGDATVRGELSALLAQRMRLQGQYYAGLAAAVVLFVLGFAAAVWAQQLEKRQTLATRAMDWSHLGTPRLSEAQWLARLVKLYWAPIALMAVFVLLIPTVLADFPRVPALLVYVFKVLLVVLAWALGVRVYRRVSADPAQEGVVNFPAMQYLANDDTFWQLRRDGEQPCEVLTLQGKTGAHWLVLTNERLLVFVSNLKERTLLAEHPRRSVTGARVLTPSESPWWQRGTLAGAVLRLEFKDGTSLQGHAAAATTAHRLVALLYRPAFDAPSASEMAHTLQGQSRRPPRALTSQTATVQVLSSLLVPGLGQWMQGRNHTGMRFFSVWVILLAFFCIPVIWTLWAPRAAVSPIFAVTLATGMLLMSLMAAWDVWRMRLRWEQ